MQAQRLAARGGRIESEDRELDTPSDEAFDIQDVQALVEPVHEESLGRGAVGAYLARVTLLDRSRIHQEGEDAEGDLRKCLRQARAAAGHAAATAGLEIGESGAQESPPPRSP